MTVKDLADKYLNRLKSTYTPITEAELDNITIDNYQAVKDRSDKLKEALDSILIRKDYTDVDNLYKAVYAQKFADESQKIKDKLLQVQCQAKEKFDKINTPIREKWADIMRHYTFLTNLHSRLEKFSDIFRLHNKIFRKPLTPIEEIDINGLVSKVETIEHIISGLNVIEKVKDLPEAILNLIAVTCIILLAFDITSIIVLFIIFLFVCLCIVLGFVLYKEDDLIAFTLQSIDEPNKELCKEIDWSSEEFAEFDLRTVELQGEISSKEMIELENRAKGVGSEEYEQEYDKYIDEYREEYSKQVSLQQELENRVNSFINSVRGTIVPLGQRYSWSYVLDYNFTIGLKDTAIEETKMNVKNKVIVVSVTDRNRKEDVLLLLATNMLSNVRCTNLDFMYYDRINRGDALVSYSPISKVMKIYTVMADIVKDIDDLMSNTTRKVKKITRDIDKYNEGADNEINLPTPYTMAIFEITDTGDGKTELEDHSFTDKIPGMLSSGIIPVIITSKDNMYKLPYDCIKIKC